MRVPELFLLVKMLGDHYCVACEELQSWITAQAEVIVGH